MAAVFSYPLIAVLVALFLWWGATGALLWLVFWCDRSGGSRPAWAVVLGLPLLFGGLWMIVSSAHSTQLGAVYGAFIGALGVWAWLELTFLTGLVTGPNRSKRPAHAAGWDRFKHAAGTVIYHEIFLAIGFLLVFLVSAGGSNRTALYTFGLLFFARISSKLNLFLGVPFVNVEFLPSALAHLPSHFHKAAMNWLFPISISALSAALLLWIVAAGATGDIAPVLIATMTGLALLEHWFLVLPLPDEKLWRWMIATPKNT